MKRASCPVWSDTVILDAHGDGLSNQEQAAWGIDPLDADRDDDRPTEGRVVTITAADAGSARRVTFADCRQRRSDG